MDFDEQVLAMRIKRMRNKRNITQEHLAELADLSVVFVSHIERAKRTPSLETLIKVCNALDCTTDELLDGFLTAKPAQPDRVERLLIDCTIGERKLLLKMCDAFKDFLKYSL